MTLCPSTMRSSPLNSLFQDGAMSRRVFLLAGPAPVDHALADGVVQNMVVAAVLAAD